MSTKDQTRYAIICLQINRFRLVRKCPRGVIQYVNPYKPLWKINCPSAITRLTAHVQCGLMSDLVSSQHSVINVTNPNHLHPVVSLSD